MKEKLYYRKRAEIIRALANPYRLQMVEMLAQGEMCMCEFDGVLELDYSTISRHLTLLRKAGIAGYRKQGKQVFYHLRVPCLLGFLTCFDEVLKKDIERDTRCLSSGTVDHEHS